jgi:hypothetical protein
MNRPVPALLMASVVIVLAVLTYLFGVYLMPSRVEAIEKGTLAPWYIVWLMIGIMELCCVALAVFLVRVGFGGPQSHA